MTAEAWRYRAQENTQSMRFSHKAPPHDLVGNRLEKEAQSYQKTEPMVMWMNSSHQTLWDLPRAQCSWATLHR